MKPPEYTKVFETSTGKYWFEGDLLYIVGKKGPQLDLQTAIKDTEEFKQKLGDKTVCAIIDVSETTPASKEVREYNSQQLTHLFKAIAFVIKNPLTSMLAHVYMGVKPMPFPVKMFSNEKEACAWITQYL
jgi:hypothetical protein